MSETEKQAVFNAALMECGEELLASPGQSSSEGFRLLDAIYAGVVTEMLEELDWDWAQTHTISTGVATLSTEATPFGYVHTLPSGFVRLVSAHEGGRAPADWQIRYHLQGQSLYCDYETAEIAYVDGVKGRDQTLWPEKIRRVVALMLADRIAARIGSTKRRQEDIERRYRSALKDAKGAIRVQRGTQRMQAGRFVQSNYGFGRGYGWRRG